MYLRGRCINFYAPTDIAADYDFTAVSDVPEEQLKLEWVYPFAHCLLSEPRCCW